MFVSRFAAMACGACLLVACGTKTPLELPLPPTAAPANASTGTARP